MKTNCFISLQVNIYSFSNLGVELVGFFAVF